MGTFYLFQFPLLLIGIIVVVKRKLKNFYIFIIWTILTILVLSLSKEVPHATRGYFLVIPVQVFSAIGLIEFWNNNLSRYSSIYKRRLIIFILMIFISINFIRYTTSYFIRFPILYAKAWRLADKKLTDYLKKNQADYSRIIIDQKAGLAYTSLLFYLQYPPQDFYSTVSRFDDTEGFSNLDSFGKYEFKSIDWSKDMKTPNALIITLLENKPENISAKELIYYPERPIVIALKEQIVSYPFKEPAYVLIETEK